MTSIYCRIFAQSLYHVSHHSTGFLGRQRICLKSCSKAFLEKDNRSEEKLEKTGSARVQGWQSLVKPAMSKRG